MPNFKRLPYTTETEMLFAFRQGKKFLAKIGDAQAEPVTHMKPSRCDDIVNIKTASMENWHPCFVYGYSNNSEKDSFVVMYEAEDAPMLPPYKPLPFKSREELIQAWANEPHRLKFVATGEGNDSAGMYDMLDVRPGKRGERVEVDININGTSTRWMSYTGLVPGYGSERVYLIWLDGDDVATPAAKPAPSCLEDLVRDSDKPGVERAKLLPPLTTPTPAPTFQLPKTAAVAGLLVVHNPDKRSF